MSSVKLPSCHHLLASTISKQVEVEGAGGRVPSRFLVLKAGIRVLNYFINQLVVCTPNFRLPHDLRSVWYLMARREALTDHVNVHVKTSGCSVCQFYRMHPLAERRVEKWLLEYIVPVAVVT